MAIYLTVIKGFKNIITFILVLISTPASYLVISSMFFRYRREIGRVWRVSENTQEVIDNPVYLKTPVKAGIVAGAVISGIMICVYIFVGTARNPFDKVELLKVPEISAHRGSSGLAPENTMSAFKQALYDLADYVLGHFSKEEQATMADAVKEAADAVCEIVNVGIAQAMNDHNRKKEEK